MSRLNPSRLYSPVLVRNFSIDITQRPSFYQNQVLERFLKEKEQKLTMQMLMEFGKVMNPSKIIRGANYVRKELPVRLAHRISDFHKLPYVVGTNKHIESTYYLYWIAFDNLRKIPEIKTLEDNEAYCDKLRELLKHHSIVLPKLVLGLQQAKSHFKNPKDPEEFFKRMLTSRISRRLLAEQHLKLSNQNSKSSSEEGFVGVIHPSIHAKNLIQRCYDASREVCIRCYGACPDLEINGQTNAVFAGVPYHAEYVFYELFKNSMRAVVERFGKTTPLPLITVTIAESESHVMFRLSDEGGGLEHESMQKVDIWDYDFSTAPRLEGDHFTAQMGATLEEQLPEWPMAGLGSGLPISRVFAEYFGGSLTLQSLHGKGLYAYYLTKKKVEDHMDYAV